MITPQAIRDAVLEECAQHIDDWHGPSSKFYAEMIRALKSAPAPSEDLATRLAAAQAILREVEEDFTTCPLCGEQIWTTSDNEYGFVRTDDGHAEDCALAKAIGEK